MRLVSVQAALDLLLAQQLPDVRAQWTNDSRSITSSIRRSRSHFSASRTGPTSMISLMRPGPARHHDDAVGEVHRLLDARA